jgi:leucyl aminopeptidase (aminopeptidase T)
MSSPRVGQETIWHGITNLFDHYVGLRPGDLAVVVYTPDAREHAAMVVAELKRRDHRVCIVGMYALEDPDLESRFRQAVPPPEHVPQRLVVLTLERNSMSHAVKLRRALAIYPESAWVVFRAINVSDEFFATALHVTPTALSSTNAGLLNRMMPAKHMRIQSSSGTDLEVDIDSEKYRWLSNRGMWREGAFVVLPPGEVSTFPANMNGILVADGAFNVTAYTEADARLAGCEVRVEIEEGRAVHYSCDDPTIKKLLDRCMKEQNAEIVGELGFGTNTGIEQFIAMNSHINERHPGVHLGFGQHGQKSDVLPWSSPVHMDLITSDALMTLDTGETIDSTKLCVYQGEHPTPLNEGVYDEDIDGDCCGIIDREIELARAQHLHDPQS